MRTNIDIDDKLMAEAMSVFGARTKKAAVERALRDAIRMEQQRRAIAESAGIGWEGNLRELRELRDFDLDE